MPGPGNPLRAAMEARDPALLASTLAPDVVLHSPIISTPFEGVEELVDLFTVIYGVLGPVEFVADVPGDPHITAFKTDVGGEPIEGVDLVRYDDEGRILEVTVFLRPFRGVAAFLDATGPDLARRRGGRGSAALMRVLGPPPSLALRSTAAMAPRMLRLKARGRKS